MQIADAKQLLKESDAFMYEICERYSIAFTDYHNTLIEDESRKKALFGFFLENVFRLSGVYSYIVTELEKISELTEMFVVLKEGETGSHSCIVRTTIPNVDGRMDGGEVSIYPASEWCVTILNNSDKKDSFSFSGCFDDGLSFMITSFLNPHIRAEREKQKDFEKTRKNTL